MHSTSAYAQSIRIGNYSMSIFRCGSRAACKEVVQHGLGTPRAPARSRGRAPAPDCSITSRQPVSSHTRSKASAGPMRLSPRRSPRRCRARRARSPCRRTAPPSARAAPVARSPQVLDLARGARDQPLAHRLALAPALDNLEIGATTGSLLSEIHGGEPRRRLISVRTQSSTRSQKSTEISAIRGTTYSCPRTVATNYINSLFVPSMLQLSRSA